MNVETKTPRYRRWIRGAALLGVVVLLPSCSAWSWLKQRFSGGPPLAPPAAVSAPASVVPPPSALPAPVAATPLPMPESTPESMPAPPMATAVEPATPLVAPPDPITTEPLPVVTPPPLPDSPPMPAPIPAPIPQEKTNAPATADMRPGRWGVQVGVFLVDTNAETIRAKLAGEFANDVSFSSTERVVRGVKKGARTHVVVGEVADRRSAEALAARLRAKLRQDVVLFQR